MKNLELNSSGEPLISLWLLTKRIKLLLKLLHKNIETLQEISSKKYETVK